jgi:hypothetical protein
MTSGSGRLMAVSALGCFMTTSEAEPGIERDVTETMAIFYVAAELCRRNWRVFLPVSGRVKGYDFVASKGARQQKVEVKGLQSDGPFAWGRCLDPDVIIVGVRARSDRPPEFYIGTATEYNSVVRGEEQNDWKPWQEPSEKKFHWRDGWGKFE